MSIGGLIADERETLSSQSGLFPASIGLEHVKLERALLAAHRELAKRPARHAGRQRGEAGKQGRGRQHAIVGFAASLLDALGGVHRVADEGDLLLAELAVPVRRQPGVEVRVFSGASGGVTGPTKNFVPVTMVEIRLDLAACRT